MAKIWTRDDIRAMSVHDRANLYKSACALGHTEDGAALKTMIEEEGLPYSEDAALKGDDPITLKIIEVIYSPEGRAAGLKWHADGWPPMAGIDPLLQEALGVDYGPHNMGTHRAGEITGALMRSLGFQKGPNKDLPSNCVAKSAATWV